MGKSSQLYVLALAAWMLMGCQQFSSTLNAGSNNSSPSLTSGTGPIQYPDLLESYTARPTWQVSGVDFTAGPQVTEFLDPETISMSGVTVDTATHIVTVTGSNVTLDGYDFSLEGGWQVSLTGASGTIIENCNWKIGTNQLAPIVADSNSSDLYVGYNTIDGANMQTSPGALITMNGIGLTVEYSWLQNSYGDVVDYGGSTVVVQYNLIDNCAEGTTGNVLSLSSSNSSVKAIYNTIYQPAAIGAGSLQGFLMAADTITSADVGNNTIVALASSNMGYFVSLAPGSTGTATVHDNWMDPTGATGFAEAGSSGSQCYFLNNTDLATDTAFPTDP